jgi:RNA polymerase sigma-70 factor, ECF subfamily
MTNSNDAPDRFHEDLVALLPKLRRFAFGLAGSRADGDDLVQGALAKALTSRDQWQPGTRLDSWLYRIIQNHWIDTVRAQRARGETVPLDDAHDLVGDDGLRTAENTMALAKMKSALATLPEEQRAVLVMVGLEGVSYAAAAETLGIPIGTVMSRLARGRAALAMAVYGEAKKPR